MQQSTIVSEIDQQITLLLSFMEDIEKLLVYADDKADLILDVRNGFLSILIQIEFTRNSIEYQFADISSTAAAEIIARIFPIFGLSARLVQVSKETGIVYKLLRGPLDRLILAIDDLYEIVNDLSKYKVRKDAIFSSYIS